MNPTLEISPQKTQAQFQVKDPSQYKVKIFVAYEAFLSRYRKLSTMIYMGHFSQLLS